MFHHYNYLIRFGHFEHLELPRRRIVTWHLLAANSKLVENFEPSSEYSLWCWQQRIIVSEYSQLACEWFLPWQEIRLKTYGIFSFRQLREGGIFGPDAGWPCSGNPIDLKFCTVIVLDKTIKFTKFQENTIALSWDMTSWIVKFVDQCLKIPFVQK